MCLHLFLKCVFPLRDKTIMVALEEEVLRRNIGSNAGAVMYHVLRGLGGHLLQFMHTRIYYTHAEGTGDEMTMTRWRRRRRLSGWFAAATAFIDLPAGTRHRHRECPTCPPSCPRAFFWWYARCSTWNKIRGTRWNKNMLCINAQITRLF